MSFEQKVEEEQQASFMLDIADMMKMETSAIMSMKYDELLQKPVPTREEYETEEEFKEAEKAFMLESIDYVSTNKHALFLYVLNQYNDFIAKKRETEETKKKAEKDHNDKIDRTIKNQMKSIGASLIALLIVPQGFPVIAALGGGTFLTNRFVMKREMRQLVEEQRMMDAVKEIQNRFFELTDILRTDFHKSNKKYEELREKVKNGENIMPELLEMLNPESIGIPKTHFVLTVDPLTQKELGESNDKPIEFVYHYKPEESNE